MNRLHALSVISLVWLAMPAVSSARAAEGVLGVVPDDSLGFVVINRLTEVDAKLQALGQRMQLPVPSPLALAKASVSVGVQQAVDEKGSVALVAMPPEDADSPPAVLIFLPVTDYQQLLKQLQTEDSAEKIAKIRVQGELFIVGNKGGYAVFTEPKNRRALEQALKTSDRVAKDVAPWREWLAGKDIAGVLTQRGIKLSLAKFQEGLEEFKTAIAQASDKNNPGIAVFDLYGKIFKALGKEVDLVAIGVEIDETGNLHLTKRARLVPGGRMAAWTKEAQPLEGDGLAGVPAGPFVAAFAMTIPQNMYREMMKISIDLIKAMPDLYGLSEDEAEKLSELSTESMKGLRGISMAMGVGKPGEPIYSNMVGVMQVGNAQAFMKAYEQYIHAMAKLSSGEQESILSSTRIKQIQIDGKPALELSMKMPQHPATKEIPGYSEMMEKIFGPGGKMTAYMAIADEHTVVWAYTTQDSLLRSLSVVRQSEAGLAGDKDVAKTAAMLPSGVQAAGYWSPAGTIAFVNRGVTAFAPQVGFKLPQFPKTPPVGFAAKVSEAEVQTYLIVPAPVLEGIGGYVGKLRGMWAKPGVR